MLDIISIVALVVYILYCTYTVCKTAKRRKQLLKLRDNLSQSQIKRDLKRLNQLIDLYLK